MNIRQLDLTGFTKHDDTRVELPERGLVLVSGDNGSGKSSLMEAVAWSCWGKTLRGADPWRSDDELCLARTWLHGRDLPIERVRKKGKSLLSWSETEYETATKAQEALEGSIGLFDVWRRTHVFSSQDAAHFSLATDSERKRLLESILGLDRFDAALDACRADLKVAEGNSTRKVLEEGRLIARLAEVEKRLIEHRASQKDLPPAVDVTRLRERVAELRGMAQKANREYRAAQAAISEAERAGGGHDYNLQAAERQLSAIKNSRSCSTCGQGIPHDMIERLKSQVETEREKQSKHRAGVKEKVSNLRSHAAELEEEDISLRARCSKLEGELAAGESVQALRERIDQLVYDTEREHAELGGDVETVSRLACLAQKEVATLKAVEHVLGLKGVRAHVLGRALSGVEAISNSWLAKIAGLGLSVRLKSYKEKKTGGVSDAISMEVVGAGGGRGYAAASGGERRRIDVALLLALADVATAARGVQPGTLFFDEVFDALDPAGIGAVSGALADLAKQRCVVVVTHVPSLAQALSPDVRLQVSEGRVA